MCNAIISRGGVGKSASTSCMRNHLRWKHSDVFSIVRSSERSLVADDQNVSEVKNDGGDVAKNDFGEEKKLSVVQAGT